MVMNRSQSSGRVSNGVETGSWSKYKVNDIVCKVTNHSVNKKVRDHQRCQKCWNTSSEVRSVVWAMTNVSNWRRDRMELPYLGPIVRSGTGIPIEWESEGEGGHNGTL